MIRRQQPEILPLASQPSSARPQEEGGALRQPPSTDSTLDSFPLSPTRPPRPVWPPSETERSWGSFHTLGNRGFAADRPRRSG